MNRIMTLGILLVLAVGRVAALDGLALMKVDVGARPSGMGAAFVAIADDPHSPSYNPAAAVGNSQFGASFGHNAYWNNVRLETGYMATPLSGKTYIHAGIRYATVDDIEARTIPSSDPVTLFSAADMSFKVGVAYQLTNKVAAGIGVGWFIEKIDEWRGSAFNVDLGVLAQVRPDLTVGASVTNIGSSFILESGGRPGSRDITLPVTYRAGGAYRFDRYLAALDLVYVDEKIHAHLGAEAKLHESLSVRAGYMANYDTKSITAGATFRWHNFAADYAFVPYSNDLGSSNLINLTVRL